MTNTSSMDYVNTPAALAQLCAQLAGQPVLVLDTEFIREDTYYPRLCLIQVATPDVIACVDPIALESIAPFLEHVYDPAVRKVLHASHQDLEIFYHLCASQLPTPISDTQIAAALLGWPSQSSYAALVSDVLGVTLSKAHSRTDWSRRPLSPEQLDYAADDVRYLVPLHQELQRRLSEADRLEWFVEDCRALSDPSRYHHTPDEAWRRIRGTQHLTSRQLKLLRALAAWRETAASHEDRPRGWLLRDEALIEIARLAPDSQAQLAEIPAVPRKAAERYGAVVIETLRSAAANSGTDNEDDPGRSGGAPTKEEKSLLKQMTDLVRSRASELKVDPTAIAARKDLLGLMQGDSTSLLLQGWRKDVIGTDLQTLIRA